MKVLKIKLGEVLMILKTTAGKLMLVAIILLVALLGLMVWSSSKYGSNLVATASPSPTITPTVSPVNTKSPTATTSASSNLYTNDLGYSFVIPTGYVIQVEEIGEGTRGQTIRFAKKTSDLVSEFNYVELIVFRNTSTLTELATAIEKDLQVEKKTNIKIDGTDAIKYNTGGISSALTVIGTNGKLSVTLRSNISDDWNFYNQVLSTFKFTK